MPTNYPIFNTDPNAQSQAALLDQRQALAQMLLQAGMQQDQGGTQMAGQFAIRKSPLEGLAKMFQAYAGSQMMQKTAEDRGSLAAQAYANALQANQPQRPPSYTPDQVTSASQAALSAGAQQPQPGTGSEYMPPRRDIGPTPTNGVRMGQMLMGQQPGDQGAPANPRNPLNMPAELITNFQAGMMPKEVFDAQAALYKPTDATVQARQGGMDPVDANRQALAKALLDPKILAMKQAGIPDDLIKRFMMSEQIKSGEIDRKAGNQYFNYATGASGMVPKLPENANPVGPVQPNGAIPGVAPIPGALPVAQSNSAAAAAGKSPFEIVEGWDPTTGKPFKNFAGNVMTPPGVPAMPARGVPKQPGETADGVRAQIEAVRTNGGQPITPELKPAIDREVAALQAKLDKMKGGVQSGPELGAVAGANSAQTELSDKWAKLTKDNASAQTVIARLQTVKQLGPKAITGYGVERRDLMNGLLSIAGIRGAEDAKTASDLVDKNAAQIVTALRMGQGGAGTDALQAQLSQANPSRHMTMDAINEAVDNLSSVQQMMQAKTKALQAHATSRDPVAYSQKEVLFDQNADPRVWQMKSMTPQQLQQFTSKLSPAERQTLAQKYTTLKQNGWLQ